MGSDFFPIIRLILLIAKALLAMDPQEAERLKLKE